MLNETAVHKNECLVYRLPPFSVKIMLAACVQQGNSYSCFVLAAWALHVCLCQDFYLSYKVLLPPQRYLVTGLEGSGLRIVTID